VPICSAMTIKSGGVEGDDPEKTQIFMNS
jgi:hypothetical protein